MPVLLLLALLIWAAPARAAERNLPDRLEMEDGSSIPCLILRNSAKSVLIQTKTGEIEVPKDEIRRIYDAPDDDVFFADVVPRGELPSWRSIVHDMRTHDGVKSFEQIPATAINSGLLRNIPYMSFRVNSLSELNVYGPQDNPVAIEFGVYAGRKLSKKRRQIFKEFIAGHLDTREEIGALYRLNPNNRKEQGGKLSFRLIGPDEPDGYGGWWLVVYRPDRIEKARVNEAAYAKVTMPFDKVNRRNGSLRTEASQANADWLSRTMQGMTGSVPTIRGFYRDKEGVFHVISYGNDGES